MSIRDYRKVQPNADGIMGKYHPIAYIPEPKDDDYERGYINRYFIRKRNDKYAPVIEIDEYQFAEVKKASNLSQSIFMTHQTQWKIAGSLQDVVNSNGYVIAKGVLSVNEALRATAEAALPGCALAMKNLKFLYRA